MKKILFNLVAWCCFLPLAQTQVSFGLRIGASPSVNPSAPPLFTNREDPANESLFDVQQVDYSNQFGILVRSEYHRFWFMGEALYGQSTSQYSFRYTYRSREENKTDLYKLKKSYLQMPVTAGVKLGLFEVFSGFFVSRDLEVENEMTQMNKYSINASSWQLGWHSGVGLNLGMVLLDVRYQQEFNNYGSGQYLNSQELVLKNVPAHLTATLGLRLK